MFEINTNNFNNLDNNINNQNDLFSLLEQSNYERDQAINTLNNFRNKYQKGNEDYQTIKENYSSLEQNLLETQKKYKVIENKLSESIDDLLDKERK